MKILLADDTEINRLYLGEAFTLLGASVQTCVDGRASLELASSEYFDLLVLDIRMPQYFGDEVLRLLRQSPGAASRHSPAVAVSSEMDPDMAERLLSEGFVAALIKPVRADAVLSAAGLTAPTTAPPVAPLDLPDDVLLASLDDAMALRALGSMHAVERLRGMLAQELRARTPALYAAVAAFETAQIREWIHQMRASCALCGAARLDRLLLELRGQVLLLDWTATGRALDLVKDEIAQLYRVLDARDG